MNVLISCQYSDRYSFLFSSINSARVLIIVRLIFFMKIVLVLSPWPGISSISHDLAKYTFTCDPSAKHDFILQMIFMHIVKQLYVGSDQATQWPTISEGS